MSNIFKVRHKPSGLYLDTNYRLDGNVTEAGDVFVVKRTATAAKNRIPRWIHYLSNGKWIEERGFPESFEVVEFELKEVKSYG